MNIVAQNRSQSHSYMGELFGHLTGVLVVCIALGLFSPLASAGVVLDWDATWPDSFIRAGATAAEATNHIRIGTVQSRPEIVQTFTVDTAFQIDKFFIEYNNAEADAEPAPTGRFNLYPVSNQNTADASGASLVNFSVTLNKSIGGSWNNTQAVLEVDLTGSDEVTLAAQTYALSISSTDSDFIRWMRDNDDSGAGNESNYGAGTSFAPQGGGQTGGNRDFALAFVAVPEPATMLLLAFSAVMLGATRHRRR